MVYKALKQNGLDVRHCKCVAPTKQVHNCILNISSVLVSLSCPKALYHLRSDNIFRITVVVADWLD